MYVTSSYRVAGYESTGNTVIPMTGFPVNVRPMSVLAARLKARREEFGWSQQDLADRMPVSCSQSAIADIEIGKTRNPRYIIELAVTLGVSVKWLKGLTEDPSPETPDKNALSMQLTARQWALLQDFRRLEQNAPKLAEAVREQIHLQAELLSQDDSQSKDPE